MVGLCVAVFGFCVLDHGGLPLGIRLGSWTLGTDFSASEVLRWGALGASLGEVEPFRRLAAVFVHLGILHLVFNMLALVSFGAPVEDRVGSARFLVLFVLTGFLGFWLSDLWYAFSVGSSPLTAGASGSIFGLAGAEIGWLAAKRDPDLKDRFIRFAVYAAIFSLVFPVNNAAHLGGFCVGVPLGWSFEKDQRPWRRAWLFNGLAALAVSCIVGSLILSLRSPVWQQLREEELRMRGRGQISLLSRGRTPTSSPQSGPDWRAVLRCVVLPSAGDYRRSGETLRESRPS